jgi:hypothetical protein
MNPLHRKAYQAGYLCKEAGIHSELQDLAHTLKSRGAMDRSLLKHRTQAQMNANARRKKELDKKWAGVPEMENMNWDQRMQYAKDRGILGYAAPKPGPKERLLQQHAQTPAWSKEYREQMFPQPGHRIKPDVGGKTQKAMTQHLDELRKQRQAAARTKK